VGQHAQPHNIRKPKPETRNSNPELLRKLAPLGDLDGVSDYFLLDRDGAILARKPDSTYDEETAGLLAEHVARAGEILRLLSDHRGDPRPASASESGMAAGPTGTQNPKSEIRNPKSNPADRVFEFQFKGALLVAWDLEDTYLVAQCRENANAAILRMTVNVIQDELKQDRRLRSCLTRKPRGRPILREQDLGTERYRQVVALARQIEE
jgi:hypothetical protein